MSEIFKVQRPVFTTLHAPEVLIYNEDRSVQITSPLNEGWKTFFGDEYKMYIRGELTEVDGQPGINVEDIIPEDQWPEW